ncbi:tRNA pseudouridine(38-40) synthase TruA [Schlegelella aquatica]|uniref:tRNA pseudouridine(38-40) synthase TruA n=1 Tax=Caldimonas aquatica TaxID=376175 RepID=UPI003750D947
MRIALGISYRGTAYKGWQSQPGGGTVQDHLEQALERFTGTPVRTVCAGRTDAGVHALNQVVHFDTDLRREPFSWVRGPNTFLPADIAVEWCQPVPDDFHARNAAIGRRYAYLVREAPTRPSLDAGRVGWVFRPLDGAAMREAAAHLLGEHDFSAFRSSECQAKSPIKIVREIRIRRVGAYWRFDFEASAFLHHMVRNIMGCLIAVGTGLHRPEWVAAVRDARDRRLAAPTFASDGLYFLGPRYDERYGVPQCTPALDFLPGTPAENSP